MAKSALHLSPSEFHKHLMANTKQALAYDGGDVAAWQKRLRRKLRELVGPMPARRDRVPLKVRSFWKRDHELGTIEKIAFTAEPHSDATAYLCIPRNAAPPYTWFVCVQGHSTGAHVSIAVDREDEKTFFQTDGDRDFGIGCMRRGIAALCLEQRSFGLRREQKQQQRHDHGCIDAVMHSLLLGRTLIGERVFDVDRAIDYLATRDDVEMSRLGVMGNSGGGTTSLFAAALLDRVRVAMPSCFFCTFADSIMSIVHCPDNYVPRLMQYAENADVMGLFAPRPLVIVAGKEDNIFPIAGVRKAFKQLKRIYAAAGAADNCKLVVGDEGHRFYAEQGWKAMLAHLKRMD